MDEKKKRNILNGLAVVIIFLLISLLVFIIALIIQNRQAIGTALSSIPQNIWNSIMDFPLDNLISAGIGASIAFISMGIVLYFRSKRHK